MKKYSSAQVKDLMIKITELEQELLNSEMNIFTENLDLYIENPSKYKPEFIVLIKKIRDLITNYESKK